MSLPLLPQQDILGQVVQTQREFGGRLRHLEGLEFLFGEAAAMLLCCGGPPPGSQSIPSGVWTYVDFNFASGGTWGLGLTIEDGHVGGGDGIDKVRTTVVPPGASIFLFTLEIGWAVNAAGYRQMLWVADDGSAALYNHPLAGAAGECNRSEIHWRRQVLPAAWYSVQVWQNSGAPLDLTFMNFGVWRMR